MDSKNQRTVTFEIEATIGVISTREDTGWSRELNLVSWNGENAKFDIRSWDAEHRKMSRGITLTEDEARKLVELLKMVIKGV